MPSKNIYAAAFALALTSMASLPAQAAIINYTSFLSPASGSSANGGAGITFQYDNISNSLSWTIAFEKVGLGTGGATEAHFHSVSQTGPIEINLDDGVNSDDSSLNATIWNTAIGSESGNFAGIGTLSTTQVADLLAGNLYVNIHSTNYASGELYGQILEAQVVPVPAAIWLFGSGLLGLVGLARRKNKA
jgi:hypothetical protein